MSSAARSPSFPSNIDTSGLRMSRPRSRRPVRRVSSAATSATDASVSRARSERSPRFPIGVPTR